MVLTLKGFEPAAEMDSESLREYYTLGSTYQVEAKKARSLPQLRQWWGILGWVKFHDRFGYSSKEQINEAILIEQNLTTPQRKLDGTVVMVADSIAFKNMDAKTFSQFMDRGLEIIHAHWDFDIKTMLEQGVRLTVPTKRTESYQTRENHGRSETPQRRDSSSEVIWDDQTENAA